MARAREMTVHALKLSRCLPKAVSSADPTGLARTFHGPLWRFGKSLAFSFIHKIESTSNNLHDNRPHQGFSTFSEFGNLEINQHNQETLPKLSQKLSTVSGEFPDHDDPGSSNQQAEPSLKQPTEGVQLPTPYSSAIRMQRSQLGPRGIYKAILLGEAGHAPVQKILRNGRTVTIFSVGTGGMHNNRRPLDGESPEEYAAKSLKQWHRVAIYQDRIGVLAMRHMRKGTQVYLEGDIETRVFIDPGTNAVKRIREIAVRQNGRLLFMEQEQQRNPGLRLRQESIPAASESFTDSFALNSAAE